MKHAPSKQDPPNKSNTYTHTDTHTHTHTHKHAHTHAHRRPPITPKPVVKQVPSPPLLPRRPHGVCVCVVKEWRERVGVGWEAWLCKEVRGWAGWLVSLGGWGCMADPGAGEGGKVARVGVKTG